MQFCGWGGVLVVSGNQKSAGLHPLSGKQIIPVLYQVEAELTMPVKAGIMSYCMLGRRST